MLEWHSLYVVVNIMEWMDESPLREFLEIDWLRNERILQTAEKFRNDSTCQDLPCLYSMLFISTIFFCRKHCHTKRLAMLCILTVLLDYCSSSDKRGSRSIDDTTRS